MVAWRRARPIHDPDHLELALRLARDEGAAKSAMMAQFSKEVSDDDGDGNQTGDGGGAEEGGGEDGTDEAMSDVTRESPEAIGGRADNRDGQDPGCS